MNTKHTPGPWSFEPAFKIGEHWAAGAAHGVTANDNKDKWRGYVTNVLANSPNAEANARLIAAAPDMLAALLHAQEAVLWYGAEEFEIGGKNLGDVLRAAIAKATGAA
jgi:hypothetical protein